MKTLIFIFFIFITACATPTQRFHQQAEDLGFISEQINSATFQHTIYLAKNLLEGGILHIYLDGDGTPWERNRWIADDPTARNPLILRLMKQDKAQSILLGRPCYYGLSHTLACDSKYWTSHRYSKEVVDSMSQVLNSWLLQHKYNEVVLIGYSGGGALAILMADKIKNLSTVVTLAANLDVTKWSEFHGYLALKQSLNPADAEKLSGSIKQIHFAGQVDEVVPSFIIQEFSAKQENAEYFELSGKDHTCCWDESWEGMLELIQ